MIREIIEELEQNEFDFLGKAKKFLMKNSKTIAKWFLDHDKNYGLHLSSKVIVEKVFNDTLVNGYYTAIVIFNGKDALGVFEEAPETGNYKWSKIDEFSDNVDVYYFTK